MHWEVTIPALNDERMNASVMVEADNWFSALRFALDESGESQALSNLSCDMRPDRRVDVTDFVSRRVFQLRPLEAMAPVAAPSAAAPEVAAAPAGPTIFFTRDEPDPSGSVHYRERLIAVAPGTSFEDARALAITQFEALRQGSDALAGKLFVNVQVFDHVFAERAERPALAALTWKAWSPRKPKIFSPLAGEVGAAYSLAPPPPMPGEMLTQPPPAARPMAFAEPTSEPIAEPLPLTQQLAPAAGPAPAPVLPPPAVTPRIDERIVEAFERIQDIFSVRDHDGAARFLLELACELVPCEAASTMLIRPGRYELYIAAAVGPVAGELLGKSFPWKKGIVGFSTRNNAIVNVNDPAHDPRFAAEFDAFTGFESRSVLCAPLQHEGHTLGAIELINSARPGGFSQDDANVVGYLAGATAEHIRHHLPSREADFTDREFVELVAKPTVPPQAGAPVPAKGPDAIPHQPPPSSSKAPAARASVAPAAPGKAAPKPGHGKKKKR